MTELTREQKLEQIRERLNEQCSRLWPPIKPEPYFNEPWLYDKTYKILYAFADLPDDRYYTVASSFAFLSHRVPQFETVPYLHLWGQTQSGKTRLQKLFRKLCHRGLLASDLTPATVYQSLSYWQPTLLVDERDKDYWKTEMGQVMLSVLNSGYQRDVPVLRANREGGPMNIYDTFGPKTISGIRALPFSLAERCIRLKTETAVRQIPYSLKNPALDELAANLQAYHEHYKGASENLDIDFDELNETFGNGRATELYGPLYAVCPTVEGRRDLLDMAKETIADFHADESASEMAEVLEHILDAWLQVQRTAELASVKGPEPTPTPLSRILEGDWNTMPEEIKRPGTWASARIRDLGFKPYRTNIERGYTIDRKRLSAKVRRLIPARLSELEMLSSNTLTKSDNVTSVTTQGGKVGKVLDKLLANPDMDEKEAARQVLEEYENRKGGFDSE